MDKLLNQVRRIASEVSQTRATTRHGTITSFDPSNYAVKVALQPDGTLTGWLPLKSICAGNGWGIHCPPAIGTAVEVDFQEADGSVGTAGLSFFNDEDRPLSLEAGEMLFAHKSGATIRLGNDGALTLDDGHGAQIKLKGDGTISSTGNWTHAGTFAANGIELTTHVHKNVAAGSALSGGPQ